MESSKTESGSLIKPLVLFFVYWFLIRVTFKYVEAYFDLDSSFVASIWLTMMAAILAVQGTIKSRHRLLTLAEKVKFTIVSVGVIASLELLVLIASDVKIESSALLFAMTLVVFLNFCGVWLGVSTFASKLLQKELDPATR